VSSNQITVVGNVVDSPVRRRAGSGEVTKFRLAATDRYYDSAAGQWVDGDTFYVDVDAWNALGASVSASVFKGDPVLVVGKIATSEYEVDGAKRSRPVIKAAAVGHDLSRGSAVFKRTPRTTATEVAPVDAMDGSQEDPAEDRDLAAAGNAPF